MMRASLVRRLEDLEAIMGRRQAAVDAAVTRGGPRDIARRLGSLPDHALVEVGRLVAELVQGKVDGRDQR